MGNYGNDQEIKLFEKYPTFFWPFSAKTDDFIMSKYFIWFILLGLIVAFVCDLSEAAGGDCMGKSGSWNSIK